jgi:glycerophosphoryl diester phosphodiesterase
MSGWPRQLGLAAAALRVGSSATRGSPGAPALPLILGHRGASAHAPENSTAAFERAAADGADGVELDVLLCGTGEAVVFHDDDLARLGDGRRTRIAALTLAELRAVRLASGATIPTLGEAFEACGPSLLVNVELKASGVARAELARLVTVVAAVVADCRMRERVLVSSFNPRALDLWRGREPAVPCGLLFEKDAPVWLRRAWALPWLRPASVHPEHVLCGPAAVRRWHASAYAVHAWTVDDATEARRLRDLGVEGLITNDPAATRRALWASPPSALR